MKKNVVLFLIGASVLSGCSSKPEVEQLPRSYNSEEYKKVLVEEEKKLNERLAKVALLAAESQQIFAQTNSGLKRPQYTHEKIKEAVQQATYIPEGMERVLPINWSGPVEPVLDLLASYAGYDIRFIGTRPSISRDVTLLPDELNIKQHIDNIKVNTEGYFQTIDIFEQEKKIVVVYNDF